MRSQSYNTKQKELILETIKERNREFTIKDIYDELKGKTGLTTIYRLIDKLVDLGMVSKNIVKDVTYYQYLEKCPEDNHFYLKCEKCKEMVHVDCDCIKDLANHTLRNHNFKIDFEHLVINGICDKCKGSDNI